MTPPTELKYALPLLPECSTHDTREVDLGEGFKTFVSSLPELVAAENLIHWKEWTGSQKWGEVSAPSRCVAATCTAQQPGVLGRDNKELTDRANVVIHAMNFTRHNRRPWGPVYLLTGDASGQRSFKDLRQFAEHERRVRPAYEVTRQWTHSFDWKEDLWLEEWAEACALIGPDPRPPLLNYGLYSLAHALTQSQLEFRIPELVRAAETIIALPRGLGEVEFAKRALRIAPRLSAAPLLSGCDVTELLKELFRARSRCVHGALPFQDLAAQGERGEFRLAQLDFVAGEVARSGLEVAMENRGPHLNDRATLEAAWASRGFPPEVA